MAIIPTSSASSMGWNTPILSMCSRPDSGRGYQRWTWVEPAFAHLLSDGGMTRRNQIASALLVAILLLLAYVIYSNSRQPGAAVVATAAGQGFVPLPVENPALRLDLLEQLRKFQYEGPRRNIFSTALLPVALPSQTAPGPVIAAPVHLPGPAPLVVSAVFFGHVTDNRRGT